MGGLSKIAFAPGEPVLLTIDGATLLGWDAVLGTAKWQRAFDHPLVGVVFASVRALPRAGGNPWRTAVSGCEAVAIDAAGGVHAVDASTGTILSTVSTKGSPKAAAGRGDLLAVAVDDRVVVWREGVTHELDVDAVALAVARDGLTLGIATAEGDLVVVDARTAAVIAKHELCLDVNALTASRYGWIVATDRDLRSVDPEGVAGKILEGPVMRTALDDAAKRIAVHRTDTSITIYDWPPVAPLKRITLGKGHHLVDVSFGDGDALAVGIDRGHAAIVDLASSNQVRTEATGHRPVWASRLDVEDESTRMARTRAEAHTEPPRTTPFTGVGRLGFGLLVTAMLAFMRVVASGRSIHTTAPSSLRSIALDECDGSCARGRLLVLEEDCKKAPQLNCLDSARLAVSAFNDGRCFDVRSELSRIDTALARVDAGPGAAVTASARAARQGLTTGCTNVVQPPPYDPPRELVRLRGPELAPESEEIVLRASDRTKVWAAADGSLTVLTRGQRASCMLRTKTPGGTWRTVHDDPSCKHVAFFARGPSEAYASFDGTIVAFDGQEWKESEPALDVAITSLGGGTTPGGDLFALDAARTVHRRHGTSWTKQAITSATPEELYRGTANAPIAIGTSAAHDDAFLRWSPTGFVVGAETSVRGDAATGLPIVDLWTSPTGQLFAARGPNVGRSSDGGTTWRDTAVEGFGQHVWGRSDVDVYVGGDRGVSHFDGKTWTAKAFAAPVEAITGNATDLWVVTQTR